MSYGNRYNDYSGGYNRNSRGYNRGGGYNQRPRKARTGAKYHAAGARDPRNPDVHMSEMVSGWNFARKKSDGEMKLAAWPVTEQGLKSLNKKRREKGKAEMDLVHQSRSGIQYHLWVARVSWRRTGMTRTFFAYWNPHQRKLRIPALEMVASCSSNGGYWGSIRKRNNQSRY